MQVQKRHWPHCVAPFSIRVNHGSISCLAAATHKTTVTIKKHNATLSRLFHKNPRLLGGSIYFIVSFVCFAVCFVYLCLCWRFHITYKYEWVSLFGMNSSFMPYRTLTPHTVILPDWTLEKWALSSFTFQSF